MPLPRGINAFFISLNSYRKKKTQEIASKLSARKDPCRAFHRMDRVAASLMGILEGVRSACEEVAAAAPHRLVDAHGAVDGGSVQDMGPAQTRRFLGHRPCPFAHRTLVLYSRN